MENVTDRTSNPFGMNVPNRGYDLNGTRDTVYGYGDANADFHLIGDHPGVHGGVTTGTPFTESTAGERLQAILHRHGFTAEPYSDEPTFSNLFANYIHMATTPDGRTPSAAEYAELERFFDAELRAINAHILLPVGEQATRNIVEAYTTQAHRITFDMADLHATQLRGRGFLVVPIRDPVDWEDGDESRLDDTLTEILSSDYRQTKGVATTIG